MPFFDMYNSIGSIVVSYVRGRLICALEEGIQYGSLRLIDQQGEELLFGGQTAKHISADIHVKNDEFWLRIFCGHDLGFSEAYMHGDFETTDLKAVLNLWLENRDHLINLWSPISRLSSAISALTLRLFGQSLSNSKLNAVTGYDYDNELFKAFLSEDMMYSCAIWPPDLGGVKGDLTKGPFPGDLEAAQLYKIHHVLKKARLCPGHRLLEFGTGWGTTAIEAAKLGCFVDTLTLSVEQKKEAEERIRRAGLESHINVHLLDYRNLPPAFEKAFDAVVAIEMIEHVGVKYHSLFFQILDWALKSKRATAVITATSQPDWRYSTFQATDYGRKYQWPNVFCPSPTMLAYSAMTVVPGAFALESIEDYGHHYPRTLREWGRRFQTKWAQMSTELVKTHPELSEGDNLLIFKRKWMYMYVYAEIGFAKAYTSCHFWTFTRPENVVTPCH